jgi:uncharacterized protein (DUF2249 family)
MAASTLEATARDELNLPDGAQIEQLDVRSLGPPKPLKTTLELLETLDEQTVLVQLNDREPQFLYPKLDDRGYRYETVETDEGTLTGVWTR